MVKTLPSNAGGADLSPSWRAEIPHVSWPKYQNIKNNKSNIITLNKDFLKKVSKILKKEMIMNQ